MVDERDAERAPELENLGRWGGDWRVPEDLRGQTVARLRREGLLRPSGRRGLAFSYWSVAAAAAVFIAFMGGLTMGHRAAASNTLTHQPGNGLYMLLLYEAANYQSPTTDEASRARVKEYGDWIRSVGSNGRFVDGNELAGEGRWCRATARGIEVGTPVLDPERGKLAGYFVVEASSLDEAQAIAGHCPHFRHGGTVEIRRIVGP